MSTKESDLVTATFIYVSRSIAEGDIDALRRMQLSYKDIELFTQLRLDDLQRLALSQPHSQFVEICWKLDAFKNAVRHIVDLRNDAETKLELIKAEASREMMAHLFGMTNSEYSGYLAILGIQYPGGRPNNLDEKKSYQVWEAWKKIVESGSFDEITPQQYLELYQATDVPLRAIWRLVKTWSDCGNPVSLRSGC